MGKKGAASCAVSCGLKVGTEAKLLVNEALEVMGFQIWKVKA